MEFILYDISWYPKYAKLINFNRDINVLIKHLLFYIPNTVLNCILSVSLVVTNLHVKFYATWNDIQVYQLNQRLLSTMRGTKKVKAKWLSSRLSFWHWQLGSSPFRNIHSNFEIYQNLSCLRRNVTKNATKNKKGESYL